ncbi:MAG: hypothetical protein JNL25_06490 [Rhodospirillaceae bacterium]|nr:hypothetical protein [Rhodospirillaceae bacterium]
MTGGPGLTVSLGVIVAAFLVAAIATWQLRRPYEKRVHGVPWFALQFLAAATFFVMAAHLVSLLTGHPLQGRAGY